MATYPTKDVYAKEASEIVQAGSRVLDVRTPEEYEAGHIEGAVNVPVLLKGSGGLEPNPEFVKLVQEKFPNREEQFVVHCQGGARSRRACNELVAEYSKLVHLEKGFGSWLAEGLPQSKA